MDVVDHEPSYGDLCPVRLVLQVPRYFELTASRDRLSECDGSGRARSFEKRVIAMAQSRDSQWPELPYASWRETRDTLQLWTQVVGKIRLMQTPWLNHSWHVTLYVTSRGLTTSPIVHGLNT